MAESNPKLQKQAKPGEVAIRGTRTPPSEVVVPATEPTPATTKSRPAPGGPTKPEDWDR